MCHGYVVLSGVPSVPMIHRSIRSIGFVLEDLSLRTDVKQVVGLAVFNFDFVIPFTVPFRFQNVTGRVTGSDCFQYRPRQLANRNVFVRPARGYGYNESGQQSQATGYVHPQQSYLGPGTPGKPPRWLASLSSQPCHLPESFKSEIFGTDNENYGRVY